MINTEIFFDTYDYNPIIDQVLRQHNIQPDDNHFSRHTIEIKKKIDELKKSYKSRDYFKDMPTFDKDFSSYVIMINSPFVEEEKREKFKIFMNKKLGKDLNDKIREFIFPYRNEDKVNLGNNALIIVKFDSYEEAKLASIALNGFEVDKSHKVNTVTYIDYDRIISMEDVYTPPKYYSFRDLVKWEDINLTEMVMAKCSNKVFIGKIHYLKKEFQSLISVPTNKSADVKWSPQGKYLVINEGNSIKFYGGSKFELKYELESTIKDYVLSNNENFLITFSGYSNQKSDVKGDSKEQNKENVFIRDILNDELIRGLVINKEERFDNFKWSTDGRFLGRIKKDILIVYEAPKMQMLLDSQGIRQPIKDNIKEFYWFPNRNNIITLSEKRNGNRLNESILQFFEIPSRKTFPASGIAGLEVVDLQWHKNNIFLAVLCKNQDKNPKWSIRIFEFDNARLSHRSAHTSLSSGDINYFSVTCRWIGNDLIIAAKFKDNNLETMNISPFKMDKNTLKIDPWSSDKFLKNMKHSHFIPSSNGVHFILACMDQNNTNSYGKVDLYALFDNKINFCKSYEFTNNLENVKWDFGGRLFMIELTRKQNEGVRFFDCEGSLLYDSKDNTVQNMNWRPRHLPVLDRNIEEEAIKKNFKNISKVYEEEDSQFLSAIEQVKRAEKKKVMERFMSTVNRRRELWDNQKAERLKFIPEDDNIQIVEQEFVTEEIIHTHEEIIKTD